MVLKKLTANDLELLYSWLCEDHVREFFGDPDEWLNEIYDNIDDLNWVFYFMVFFNNKPLGFVQYYETHKTPIGEWSEEPIGTVGIDFLIGDTSMLKKGMGSKLLECLIMFIRKTNKYKFIVADPLEENKKSISLIIKNGFKRQPNGMYRLVL